MVVSREKKGDPNRIILECSIRGDLGRDHGDRDNGDSWSTGNIRSRKTRRERSKIATLYDDAVVRIDASVEARG